MPNEDFNSSRDKLRDSLRALGLPSPVVQDLTYASSRSATPYRTETIMARGLQAYQKGEVEALI